MTDIPCVKAPGQGLPTLIPSSFSLYSPAILATPVLFYQLRSWSLGLLVSWLSPPRFPHWLSSGSYSLWTLPDVSFSGCALSFIYNKPPSPPYLGEAVMSPFLSFFFSFSTYMHPSFGKQTKVKSLAFLSFLQERYVIQKMWKKKFLYMKQIHFLCSTNECQDFSRGWEITKI